MNRRFKKHPKYTDYIGDSDGNIWSLKGKEVRKLRQFPKGREGYLNVVMYESGKRKHCRVNRFILECKLGRLLEHGCSEVADHINGDILNNRFSNLQAMSNAENTRRGRSAKLTEDQVREIRKAEGTQRAIAKQYGISVIHVSYIKSRKRWANI